MGANTKLYWILSGFFLLAAAVYTVWNVRTDYRGVLVGPGEGNGVEWVGTVALFLTAVLAALIAFYLRRTHEAQKGELPSDRVNANIDDGDAEQGFYSPWSWWPIVLGASAAIVFLGIAIGVWLSLIGGAIGVVALIGWTYEYYRGYFGRGQRS